MKRFFWRALVVCGALAWIGSPLLAPGARAQDGGDIQYNSPVVVTLTAGQTVTRTIAITQGDTVEFKLTRLAEYAFTAALVDPAQVVTPLTPGADGNIVYTLENAPVGGLYTLILQATSDGGELLVQANSSTVPPVPLAFGLTSAELGATALRYSLVPPPGMPDTTLTIAVVAPPNAPAALPGLTLVDSATGETALTVAPGLLPSITVILPAQRAFLLGLTPGAVPQSLTLTWGQALAPTGAAPTPAPVASATPFPTPLPVQPAGTCQVQFVGQVNIRSGPGAQWDPPIGTATAGMTLPVTGHNGNYSWFQVSYNGLPGWVSMEIAATQATGDCSTLPVASYPPPPAPPTQGPAIVGPSPTYTSLPLVTNTPGAVGGPSPTYTPSYTPTPPIAPPDGGSNGVLDVPLDGTAQIGDYVSYPNGDTEDQAGYRVSGLNPNVAFSGGQADLAITLQCSGSGTEYIEFRIDGQTYRCGQTFTRRVNFDSNTGGIRVVATGGSATYVQWTAVGTAPRVN